MASHLFKFDALAIIPSLLTFFIAIIVGVYSASYLRSDKRLKIFLTLIAGIAVSLIITFSSENVLILLFFWLLSNLLLILIMIHKASWKQALASGILALKNFIFGFVCLSLALLILQHETGSFKISEIVANEAISQEAAAISCFLILVAALSQSAIFPFQSWLLSSLNSPTPASALMHAGLVNGGGVILARFAPLFFKNPEILNIAFALGIFSALLGTFWKLIQSNVKAMLACSTMSQMGFMIAQCAMGMFPAAIAHLFWHGMFKSYLFLSSPSAWQEKRIDLRYPPKASCFMFSLLCGVLGAAIFAKINQIELAKLDTNLVLVVVCFIAASQVALTIANKFVFKKIFPALVISSILSAIYSFSVMIITKSVPDELLNPQPLAFLHVLAILILFIAWLARLFWKISDFTKNPILLKSYVFLLNSSQPKSTTITANRNHYSFK